MSNRLNISFALLCCLMLPYGCGVVKNKPKEAVIVTYKEVTVTHDSTIYVDVPRERYVDVVRAYDTLRMETSVASATAFVDTVSHTLRGEIENKDVSLKKTIEYKDRIITRDSLVTKIEEKEVPVDVVRYPKSYWYMLSLLLGFVMYAGFVIYKKMKL